MTVDKLIRKLVRTQYNKHDNIEDAAIASAKRLLRYMHDECTLREGLLEEMLVLTSKQVIQEFEDEKQAVPV